MTLQPAPPHRDWPIMIEAWRGEFVESRHRAAAVVVSHDGDCHLSLGAADHLVCPRSAAKPIQALPLITSGAAQAFGLSPQELALACASHNAAPAQVAAVRAWLKRLGFQPQDLSCGAQPPLTTADRHALIRAGQSPDACYNNCSGQHSGLLTLARHLGHDPQGYAARDHPVQQALIAAMSSACGLEVAHSPCGIDGCGIPAFAVPLRALALAWARLGAASIAGHQRACSHVAAAVLAHPGWVAGSGRLTTALLTIGRGLILAKSGADGVYCAALPKRHLGIALKVESGSLHAARHIMLRLLVHLKALKPQDVEDSELRPFLAAPIYSAAGAVVGRLAKPQDAPF